MTHHGPSIVHMFLSMLMKFAFLVLLCMAPKARGKAWTATEGAGHKEVALILSKYVTTPSFLVYSEDVKNGTQDASKIPEHRDIIKDAKKMQDNLSFTEEDIQEILKLVLAEKSWKDTVEGTWCVVMGNRLRTIFRHAQQFFTRKDKPAWFKKAFDIQETPELSETPETSKPASSTSKTPATSGSTFTISFVHERGAVGMAKKTVTFKGYTTTFYTTNIWVPEKAKPQDPVMAKFEDGGVHEVGDLMVMDWEEIQTSKAGKMKVNTLWKATHVKSNSTLTIGRERDVRKGVVLYYFYFLAQDGRQVLSANEKWFKEEANALELLKMIADDYKDDKISKEDLKVKRKEMMLSEAWISKLNAENVQNIVGKAGMKAIEAATGEKAFGNYR